jgi:hypothetical protein
MEMEKRHAPAPRFDAANSAEDLGEDVLALASVAAERGKASMVRSVNGLVVRVIVEAA